MVAKAQRKTQEHQALFILDEKSERRLEELKAATGISKSKIVREAIMVYDPRDTSELLARAAELQAVAAQKSRAEQASVAE